MSAEPGDRAGPMTAVPVDAVLVQPGLQPAIRDGLDIVRVTTTTVVTLGLGREQVCALCGGEASKLRRLGGVGLRLCPACYQMAKRAARASGEGLRDFSIRDFDRTLYNEMLNMGLASRTIGQYMRTIWTAERWFAANRWYLARALPEQVRLYADTKPLTFASRNLLRAALKHYWVICAHPKSPAGAIRVPVKPAMVCRALESDEARLLVGVAQRHGDRRGLAVLLGLYQGLRREEIATLRWQSFDTVEAGWMKVFGKGSKTRTIPLHPTVVEALAKADRSSEWVFAGRSGKGPVCPATIWQWVRDLAIEAGLPPIRTHWTRHTALATMNDATGDLRTVQAFAGHSKPEQTAGYTRASKSRLRDAVRSMDY